MRLMETNLPDLRRVQECAEFLQGCLEDAEAEWEIDGCLDDRLADIMDSSIEETARQAGFTDVEIEAAWDIINT